MKRIVALGAVVLLISGAAQAATISWGSVTDYSSVAIDYAVLDRPIGYFCPDRADYNRGFIEEVVPAFYGAGEMLDGIEALAEFLAGPRRNSSADTSALASVRTPTASEAIWQHCTKALGR